MNLMLSQPKIDVSSNVVATVSFEPPAVRPGEETLYRVTFNALEESIAWPSDLSTFPAAEVRQGAHGQALQMAGASLQPRTTFLYHIRPSEPGQLTVPEFTVKVYDQNVTVPAAHVDVDTNLQTNAAPPQRLILQLAATDVFAGQPIHVDVLSPGSPGAPLQGLTQVQITGEGFVIDQGSVRQRFEARPAGPGASIVNFIYETTLTPLTAGKLSAFAQAFAVGNRFSGTVVISGGPVTLQGGAPQYTLVDSDPVSFQVKPLPRKGQLPGFTGSIGTFAIDPPVLETNIVHLGDPVKLTVTVRGEETLARLVAPPSPETADWQVTVNSSGGPNPAQPPPLRVPVPGAGPSSLPVCGIFTYTLVPLSDKPHETPVIPFSYFDPRKATYVDLTIPAVPLTIKPSATFADSQALSQAQAAETRVEKEPSLSELASGPGMAAASLVPLQQRPWFPLVQLAPGLVFLALWWWDRRRRYLEKHPEIVLRRRALRALRRERRGLLRAARAGDAAQFALKAVDAMRVAAAPHFPAEPKALVGGDVLGLLPESDRNARVGEVVRRFFAVTDASRYDTGAADASGLLPLKPELENVLERLEERLQTPKVDHRTLQEPQPSNVVGVPVVLGACFVFFALNCEAATNSSFDEGVSAYRKGDYARAVVQFHEAAVEQPSSGTYQNLGNAEWQNGQTGPAILAWEQSLWLDPFNRSARNNLRFARKVAQLDSPDLTWYEVVSTWLPTNWWAWASVVSLWTAVGLVLLPGIFRWRKTAWHQAVAALGLVVFLLSVPAQVGVQTRSYLGFVLLKDTALRLTPTADSQAVTRLAAGERGRWERAHGDYILIRTVRTLGWVHKNDFALNSSR
jgi:hypothetical protein